MRVLITGASGLVGHALTSFLHGKQAEVVRLVRSQEALSLYSVYWDPKEGHLNSTDLEGFDIVVNLSGENVASSRWSLHKKMAIEESRVKGTKLLCETLAKLKTPPRVLINASAVGYYGDQGETLLKENHPSGKGFLAEVCSKWEGATESAEQAGIRVVIPRFGVVLSRDGGALARMVTPFKWGLGGVLGSGAQYMSWIALEDTIGALYHVILDEKVRGPVNFVAPQAVTNHTFTKTLGKVLGRPTLLPAPAFLLRWVVGEMADEMLLSSTRASAELLMQSGYTFRNPSLEETLMKEAKHGDS